MSFCQVRRCRDGSAYVYYGKRICERHWEKHCNDKDRFNLKSEFNIRVVDKSEENREALLSKKVKSFSRPRNDFVFSSESKPRGSPGLLSSYLEVE